MSLPSLWRLSPLAAALLIGSDGQTLLVVTHEADVARRGGTTAAMSDGALTVVRAGPEPAATTGPGRTP